MPEKIVIEWPTTARLPSSYLATKIRAHDYKIAGTSECTKTIIRATVNCLAQKHIKFKALDILD